MGSAIARPLWGALGLPVRLNPGWDPISNSIISETVRDIWARFEKLASAIARVLRTALALPVRLNPGWDPISNSIISETVRDIWTRFERLASTIEPVRTIDNQVEFWSVLS